MNSRDGSGTDPLDTIPLFDVKIPLTPARAASIRRCPVSGKSALSQWFRPVIAPVSLESARTALARAFSDPPAYGEGSELARPVM